MSTKLHRPKFYRYKVHRYCGSRECTAKIGFKRMRWNTYPGSLPIGWGFIFGDYAYCVKWAGHRVGGKP